MIISFLRLRARAGIICTTWCGCLLHHACRLAKRCKHSSDMLSITGICSLAMTSSIRWAGRMFWPASRSSIWNGPTSGQDRPGRMKNLEEDSLAAELCKSYPNAGTYVLDLRLHPREKIAWLERGVLAARRSKDRTMEGAHLGNLGLPTPTWASRTRPSSTTSRRSR